MKRLTSLTIKIVLPIVLGGAILWWMYRGLDLGAIWGFMSRRMSWTWMLLSFPFGISAQVFRGMRWRYALDPIGEHSRLSTCIHAVFVSYAASLAVPRVGEFTRCGILKRYDGVSFSKALGTVVTERAIDSLLIAIVAGLTLLCQLSVFGTFFRQTGTNIGTLLGRFSTTGYVVCLICAAAILLMAAVLLRKLSFYDKVKTTLSGIWQGVLSIAHLEHATRYVLLTLGIWASYFLHYYLTFYCFAATEHLGLACAMVTFVVGSIAVIVPTPNGAGPWHFAVKTMLLLYGLAEIDALYFVLIVHTVQTLLVVAMGVYAWAALELKAKVNIIT